MKKHVLIFAAACLVLFSACVTKVAMLEDSQNIDATTTRGKPVWGHKLSTVGKITPWAMGAAGAGAGYYFFKDGFEMDGEKVSQGGASALFGIGSFLFSAYVNYGIKTSLDRQRNKQTVVSRDYDKWLKNYNRRQDQPYRLKSSTVNRDQSIDLVFGKPLPPVIPAPTEPSSTTKGTSRDIAKPKPATTGEKLRWEPYVLFDNEVFPSFVISMATTTGAKSFPVPCSGDCSSALGFQLKTFQTHLQGRKLNYEIKPVETTWFEPVRGDFNLSNGQQYFFPNVPWKFQALKELRQSQSLKVWFRLSDDFGWRDSVLRTITLRSLNDCLLSYKAETYTWMFAAYVNEEHPEIRKILTEAVDNQWIDAWTGYQTEDSAEVVRQVYAVWRVLQKRGIVYSSIGSTIPCGENVHCQSVRTFSDALTDRQANCVDGSAVFASILKKIGLYPFIILPPRHALLCFLVPSKNGDLTPMYLETTMLALEKDESKMYENFCNALKVGQYNALKDEKTTVIDIYKERERVKPIGN